MRSPSAATSSKVQSHQGQWRQERSRVSPEVAVENARKRVSGLEAAIAAMIASGMEEKSAEVTTFKGSLTEAKRDAQEALLEIQVKGAQEFVDRVQKRLETHDKVRKELEDELAKGKARLQRLRRQVEAEVKSPPIVQDPPPEWVSEIHRLRSEVARFKATAHRPVRDSVEAAQSVRAKAEKRRAGVMDNIPTDEQSLRAWMEDKNLEMHDALDAGDAEAISSLGSVIAKGADQMRALATHGSMESNMVIS